MRIKSENRSFLSVGQVIKLAKRKGYDFGKDSPAEAIIKLIFRGLIPIILLAGGLFLLSLRISAWSLIFGLPMTVISVTLLVFTYDEVVSKKIGELPPRLIEPRLTRCSICGKKTARVPGEWKEDTICPKC